MICKEYTPAGNSVNLFFVPSVHLKAVSSIVEWDYSEVWSRECVPVEW